jgi:hypothetical protein
MTARTNIPNRPAISDILIKASANGAFRARLLNSPHDALTEFEVSPEDAAILTGVHASNLKDYARQVKLRLLHNYSPLN